MLVVLPLEASSSDSKLMDTVDKANDILIMLKSQMAGDIEGISRTCESADKALKDLQEELVVFQDRQISDISGGLPDGLELVILEEDIHDIKLILKKCPLL